MALYLGLEDLKTESRTEKVKQEKRLQSVRKGPVGYISPSPKPNHSCCFFFGPKAKETEVLFCGNEPQCKGVINKLDHRQDHYIADCQHILLVAQKIKDWVRSKINFFLGPQEPLLVTVKRHKLAWFGHVSHLDSLSKTILQGTFEGEARRGRQRKCWVDSIKQWTSLPIPGSLTKASS